MHTLHGADAALVFAVQNAAALQTSETMRRCDADYTAYDKKIQGGAFIWD